MKSWRDSATLRPMPALGRGCDAMVGESLTEDDEPEEEENLRVMVGCCKDRSVVAPRWEEGRVRAR